MADQRPTFADKVKLESVAKALLAYSEEAARNPELARILDRIAVPGGSDIRVFAMRAASLSGKWRPDYESIA